MTFDRARILAEGGTYYGPENPLVECAPFVPDQVSWETVPAGTADVTERTDPSQAKRMVIEGVFQRFMPPGGDPEKYRNANKRVYTMERVGKKILDPNGPVQRRIAERAMIGHLEHPADGTTNLNHGAILVTKVWAEPDGTIKGRALVYDTPEGRRVQEYIKTGTKIGISSRGTGTVDRNGFVCEDYNLESWDIVYNPSTPGAYPMLATEARIGEPAVHEAKALAETQSGTIMFERGKTMNVAERVAQVKEQAERLLAVDPTKLSASRRKEHADALLNFRVALQEEFSGAKADLVQPLVAQLVEAHRLAETMSGDVGGFRDGPVPDSGVEASATSVPGNAWDIINRALASSNVNREQALNSLQEIAAMIALNINRLPLVVQTLNNMPDNQAPVPVVTPAQVKESRETSDAAERNGLPDDVRQALIDARDQLLLVSEREEAASAIIDELARRCARLQGMLQRVLERAGRLQSENARFSEITERLAETVAALTSEVSARQVVERQETGVSARRDSAVPPKSTASQNTKEKEAVVERRTHPRAEDDDALPVGRAVASRADAGHVSTQQRLINESVSRGPAIAAIALSKLNGG